MIKRVIKKTYKYFHTKLKKKKKAGYFQLVNSN